ncbi:MAG: hypothetical protein QGG36_32050 [Pirellulaceae bacterium]|nr:hypothetical protein [Pirellulaceae bacterium]
MHCMTTVISLIIISSVFSGSLLAPARMMGWANSREKAAVVEEQQFLPEIRRRVERQRSQLDDVEDAVAEK